MTTNRDDNGIFARRLLAARKRALKYLVRALEGQARQLAIQARGGAARARGRPRRKPLNPVTQLKREIMPVIEQLVELAAGDGAPLLPQQPGKPGRNEPKNGAAVRRRRRSASEGSGSAI
jgi:hypothetical protein